MSREGGGVSRVSPIFQRGGGGLLFFSKGFSHFPEYGNTVNTRVVRILLECFLFLSDFRTNNQNDE